MEKQRRPSTSIFRKFLFCACFLFVASFLLSYMGTVRLNTAMNELVPINEIDTEVMSPNITVDTSSILWDKLRTTEGSLSKAKDPYGLKFNEFMQHLKKEKDELVKNRIKRVAYWHAFAQLQKKVVGKATPMHVELRHPDPSKGGSNEDNDNSGDNPFGTYEANEFGDGEDTDDIRMSSEENPPANKPEKSAPVDYLKLKGRVIETKFTTVPTSFHPSPGAGVNNLSTTTTFITVQEPETFVGESAKRPKAVFGSYADQWEDSSAKSGESRDDGDDESDKEKQDENSEEEYDDDEFGGGSESDEEKPIFF